MEDVASNKRKMKELEDNLLFRLTSTQVWESSHAQYSLVLLRFNCLFENEFMLLSGNETGALYFYFSLRLLQTKNYYLVRSHFNSVSKVTLVCFGFALVCSVIGWQNLSHFPNQCEENETEN